MRKIAALFALIVATASVGWSVPCDINNLQSYINRWGGAFPCMIGDKDFSHWFYSSTAMGAPPIPASAVAVNPITIDLNPGFLFTSGFGVVSNQMQDELIRFRINVEPGGNPIEDATLELLGAGFSGTGSASIAETLCLGDTFDDGCAGGVVMSLFAFTNMSGTKLIDHITFGPVTVVDVVKDLELFGGLNGSAVASGISQQFSETPVPEPATLSLLGTGLIGLAGLIRRKFRSPLA